MSKAKTSGMSFCSVLTLIFITLKLTDVIAWSWWYVLMPSYLPLSILLGVMVLGFLLVWSVETLQGKR